MPLSERSKIKMMQTITSLFEGEPLKEIRRLTGNSNSVSVKKVIAAFEESERELHRMSQDLLELLEYESGTVVLQRILAEEVKS